MPRSIVLAVCICALAGCSGRQADEPAAQAAAAQAKPKTVLDDPLKALEKAKAVQHTVDEAAKAQQKAIDDAGG